MTPSPHQQTIYEAAAKENGFIVVDAVAGSGKSHVLLHCVQNSKADRIVMFAFNKHIADYLRGKVPEGVDVTTIHAFGLRSIYQDGGTEGRIRVDDRKYGQLAIEWLDSNPPIWQQYEFASAWEARPTLLELLNFTRLTLTDTASSEAVAKMAERYDLVAPPEFILALPQLLQRGARMAERQGVIDFTDMIWLPHRWDLATDKFEGIYIDELQDLSAAQRALTLRAKRDDSSGVLVGDPHQSIMTFAGADFDSFSKAAEAYGATPLPLSICYRCPTSHLDLARKFVPQIQPTEWAEAGEISHSMTSAQLYATATPGDMVICRNTAPLVRACLDLIRRKKPAIVKGRDLGRELTTTINAVSKSRDITLLHDELTHYYDTQAERLLRRKAPKGQFAALSDRVTSVDAAYEALQPASIDSFVREVQDVFAEGGGIVLSTVHRAKGLEADRVFILEPDLLSEETAEEANIYYVALTRARKVLGFVGKPS